MKRLERSRTRATSIGIGLRAVKGQLGELCEKVTEEITPLAQSYRNTDGNPPIIEEIVRVVDRRIRKARTLVA